MTGNKHLCYGQIPMNVPNTGRKIGVNIGVCTATICGLSVDLYTPVFV